MNDNIKITVKKSEIEYCFKAENFTEFERRFNDLKDIMYQRFINALSKRDIVCMSECIKLTNKYYDTDIAFKYANIHGGFTMKREDTAKRHTAEIAFINHMYGKRGENK